MDVRQYIGVLRRWGWILILCVVAGTVTSYWVASHQPHRYEARARYLVGPAIDSPNVDINDLRASSQIGQTYAVLASSRPVLEKVRERLQLTTDVDTLVKNVEATWIDSTQILTVRARAGRPELAVAIANAVGDALIERSPGGPSSLQAERRREASAQIEALKQAISATEAEIEQLTNQIQATTDQVQQRALIVRLDQRRNQLAAQQRSLSDQYEILQSKSTNQIAVVEPAVEATQIAPNVERSVLAALVAALVLGLAIMLVCEYFHDVMHTPEEVRHTTGLPTLAGIVKHARLRGPYSTQLVTHARPETLAAETYRILRAALQAPGGAPLVPSLLVTSPSPGDGKSAVAANLAVAFAHVGKRVILIDANLRRPRLAHLFELDRPLRESLSGLLHASELPRPYPVKGIPGLYLLPAGDPSLYASEILSSQRMYALLQEYKAHADLVIVDSPPLLYSDALALAPQVDGVLLVINRGVTDRQSAVKAVESLRLVGANLVGAVLNRVKAGPAYNYYPLYAGQQPLPIAKRELFAAASGVAASSWLDDPTMTQRLTITEIATASANGHGETTQPGTTSFAADRE